MTLIFALLITLLVATIFTIGFLLIAVSKIQKAAVRPMFLVKRRLAWQFA